MTKRTTLAALSALVLIAGLILGSTSLATAGDPYPGTVQTKTTVDGNVIHSRWGTNPRRS